MTTTNVTDAILKGSVKGPMFTGNVDGASFTGSVTYTDTTPPPETSTEGLIEGFNAASGSVFTIGGLKGDTQNANKAWSLKKIDDYTLQFEVRSGDHWLQDSGDSERNEFDFAIDYPESTQHTWTEKLTIMPGPVNTATHVDLVQLHASTNNPPSPFYIQLDTADRLEVVLQSPQGNNYIWKNKTPVVRGQEYALKVVTKMGPTGNGDVDVWLDGEQVVNFHGAVGATGAGYGWKFGCYRGPARETLIVQHRNVQIVTG